MPGRHKDTCGKQGINSCQYPFTTPGPSETIVSKMPCLGAYALSATRTRDELITSREHEPIYYSDCTVGFYFGYSDGLG